MLPDAHSERQTERLRAFRRAAEQANDVLVRFAGQQFSVRFAMRNAPDELTALPEDTFVRLTTNVRLVYLARQEAYFPRVFNIVHARIDEVLRPHLSIVRENWNRSLGPGVIFQQAEGAERETLSIKQALDALMNGDVFHQDPERQAGVRLVRGLGALSAVVLQQSVWNLAQTVVQLDSFVAYVLGEPLLPGGFRIAEWMERRAP